MSVRRGVLVGLLLAVLLLPGCVAGAGTAAGGGSGAAGFWLGLWHGFILLFTFVVSLFNHDVGIYELNNNGGWYNFGFLLGVMLFWGGGCGGARQSRRSTVTGGCSEQHVTSCDRDESGGSVS